MGKLHLLLLHHLVRVPKSSTIKIELRLHGTDRLLVLLDHWPNNLLVLRHTANVSALRRTLFLCKVAPEPSKLLRAVDKLLSEILVVVLQLSQLSEHFLSGALNDRHGLGIGADADPAVVLDLLELASKAGNHTLQPLHVIPALLLLVDNGPVFDVPCPVRIFQRVDGLRGVPLCWADTCDHESVSVASERVLKESSKLGVAVRNVGSRV